MTVTQLPPPAGDYAVDPTHTRLGFVARYALVARVRGHFHEFSGRAHVDVSRLARSRIALSIDAKSLRIDAQPAAAPRSKVDFLATDQHPVISYRSIRVRRLSNSRFKVVGVLTLRGVDRLLPLVFDYSGATRDPGGLRVNFHASTVVSRREWGLVPSGSSVFDRVMIGDKVVLELDLAFMAMATR